MFLSLDMNVPGLPLQRRRLFRRQAFTLVELLVSMSVLAVLMVLVTQVVGQVQKTWLSANTRISQFREARSAFDLVTHNLSQASLNPYWDTDQGGITTKINTLDQRKTAIPTQYVRKSDLQFVTGKSINIVQGAPQRDAQHLPFDCVFFQATLGVTQTADYERLQTLLCGRGYFLQYGDDSAFRPPFVTAAANRYRLMEYSPTSEQNTIYFDEWQNLAPNKWYSDAGAAMVRSAEATSIGNSATAVTRGFTRPIAENIVTFVLAPRVSTQSAQTTGQDPHWIALQYSYDSTQTNNITTTNPQGTQNLLPPLVDVVMIAIDEASQGNFEDSDLNKLQTLFQDARQLDRDIDAAEGFLVNRPGKRPINFRIFKTTVEIRAARWSL